MKRIEFRVTDFLDRQIEQIMLKLGISTKSEFFRMLALHSAKENLAPPPSRALEPEPELTHNEKIILSHLKTEAKSIDDLVCETHFSVQDVSVLLMNLLLKNLVLEIDSRWQVI